MALEQKKFDVTAVRQERKHQTESVRLQLEETAESMQKHVYQLLKKQEHNYYDAVLMFLKRKEDELKTVMGELSYRASLDGPKDKIIQKLTNAISKI